MTTHSDVSNHSFRINDAGAVLVIGVFMCACMVGILWYLAGIGDAILFRERLQEASDAVALSSAVLQARGMNLIVLLNLIMACILAVRVALKAVQLALLIVAATVWPAAPACLQAADVVQRVIDATRAPINNTIKVLSKTQTGIKWVAPPAAFVGARNVGQKFQPVVQEADGANLATITGLPVEEGTTGRLCFEAGTAVAEIIASVPLIPKPPEEVAGRVNRLIGKAVQMGGFYFCELGDSESDPGKDQLTRAFQAGCDLELADLEDDKQKAQYAYSAACSGNGVDCDGASSANSSLSAAQSNELLRLKAARNRASSAVSRFDRKDCEKQKREKVDEVMAKNGKKFDWKSQKTASSGMTPKKVRAQWVNGGSDAQLLAIAKGDPERLADAPRLVKIAAWNRDVKVTTPSMAGIAFSQAELFFDCGGSWKSEECNGDDDESAMWHLRWRGRLRRYDALGQGQLLTRLTGVALGLDALQRVFQGHQLPPVSLRNAGVLYDLTRSSTDLIVH